MGTTCGDRRAWAPSGEAFVPMTPKNGTMTLEITDSYTTVLRTSVGTNGSTPDTVDATCRVSERPPEQRRASVHHTVVEALSATVG